MARPILYCLFCGGARGATGEVSALCPHCRRFTKWRTTPPAPTRPDPVGAWAPSVQDQAYLRALKIDPA